MAKNLARASTQKVLTPADAKEKVIALITEGYTVEEACTVVGRKKNTYLDWRKRDKDFAAAIDDVRTVRAEERTTGKPQVPDFPEFCADWLKQPLNEHQLRMWDVISGKSPRNLHDSMTYEPGYEDRVLINTPPDHAKSTSFTVNHTVWQIHKNPDIRIVIMTQGIDLAKKFLYEIKQKLTSPIYREMHIRFAPEGGWKDPDNSWTGDAIYVRGKNADGVQKDPTVQVLGLKGTIYGSRADLIVMDDCVTTKNAREINFQTTILDREIESRLPPSTEGGGLLLILGTRVAPQDLYKTLMDVRDGDDNRVWTYFRQPAVLDYGDGPSDTWTTLWPTRWPGAALAKRRRGNNWNLVYQQLDVDDEMTFKPDAVNASVNGVRFPGLGPFVSGPGSRDGGLSGLYLVGGLDPAAAGNTAMIIAALDRETGKRWILDGWNKPNATADQIIRQFQDFTQVYQLHEWVIEQNALQRFITQIPEVEQFARSRGCRITPHFTNKNKFDSDWGVQTMAPLFDSCVSWNSAKNLYDPVPRTKHLIELPSFRQNAWVHDLIQQLTIWQPEGMAQKQKTDLVMALWFTHIAFQAQMNRKKSVMTHLKNAFVTAGGRERQKTINLRELREAKRDEQLRGIAV